MRCSQGDFVASPFREKPDMPRQICDEQQPSNLFSLHGAAYGNLILGPRSPVLRQRRAAEWNKSNNHTFSLNGELQN